MFQNLYPDEDADSAYELDYQSYYDKGYRGILFDVDNTLVEHDQPVTLVAIELFQQLKEMGFQTCIISNNRDERVKPLADALEADYVYKAGKPSARGYEQGMRWEQRRKQLFLWETRFLRISGVQTVPMCIPFLSSRLRAMKKFRLF